MGDADFLRLAAEEAEFKRVKERLTLKHKNTSQWARRALRRGINVMDEGALPSSSSTALFLCCPLIDTGFVASTGWHRRQRLPFPCQIARAVSRACLARAGRVTRASAFVLRTAAVVQLL